MAIAERKARQKAELRQEILDAARELFVQHGYESVSMRKIADKIEYSATTIYLYFEDKAELLGQLCEETFSKLDQELAALEQQESKPLACLRKGLRGYIEFGLRHPNHYRVTFMMNTEKQFEGKTGESVDLAGLRCFGHLRALVAECVRVGKLKPVDVDLASQALWAGVHGLTSLLIMHPSFPWVEDRDLLIGKTVETLIDGLR